jgi:hypothetical protein
VFSQPRFEKIFSNFVTVQLHTDKVPTGARQVPNASESAVMRDELFRNFALPYYVVLRPRGQTLYRVGTFTKGLIDDPEEFAQMLEEAKQVKVP